MFNDLLESVRQMGEHMNGKDIAGVKETEILTPPDFLQELQTDRQDADGLDRDQLFPLAPCGRGGRG